MEFDENNPGRTAGKLSVQLRMLIPNEKMISLPKRRFLVKPNHVLNINS